MIFTLQIFTFHPVSFRHHFENPVIVSYQFLYHSTLTVLDFSNFSNHTLYCFMHFFKNVFAFYKFTPSLFSRLPAHWSSLVH